MLQTKASASLQKKLLAPFIAATLIFALGMHFIWLPARLSEVRADFSQNQSSMLAVLKPALTGLLLSEDLVQVHAMLTQTAQDIPQWVELRLDDAQGRRLYPVAPLPLQAAGERMIFRSELHYQDTLLGHLTVAADAGPILIAETHKIRLLEFGLLLIVLITVGFFLWLQNLLIVRPLSQLAKVANRLADDDFNAVLPTPSNDEVGHLIRAFDAMRTKRKWTESQLVQANERSKEASQALRQRVAYQRATLDNLPFQFWLKDAEGRFLAVNKVFSDAYGLDDPDALTGKTDFDICPRESAEKYRAVDLEVMTARASKSLEEPWAGSDGTRWAEVFKKPIIDDAGLVLGTVGFARDVTERKQMVRALADSEQRWALAAKGANDGIWDWDVLAETVYFSERWKAMLGYGVDELDNHLSVWNTRIHPQDREQVMAELNRHLAGLSTHYQCEYRLCSKSGSYKWVYDRGQALFDALGKPVRMAGSLTDITERRAAEVRILDHREQLNGIFSLSPDGFVSFDHDFKVKFINPAFIQMTGLVDRDLIGLDEVAFSERLARKCKENARFPKVSFLRSGIRSKRDSGLQGDAGSGVESRHVFELADASQRVLEVRLRLANAQTVSQILYFRDVTQDVEVARMKSEFLSTAAHELRTPMTSIFGFAEVMLTFDCSEAERHECLVLIHKQASTMTNILNELLDLARIEARRGKDFQLVEIEVQTLLDEIIEGYSPPDKRSKPVRIARQQPFWIRADRGKVTQAVLNVLSNAYKYSPDGGEVEIELVDDHGAEQDSRMGICVRDHGIGMTDDQRQHVFERFYRADDSGKIPGTGLGMSIVKELIELHGGQIAVDSVFGEGTSVTLWLATVAHPVQEAVPAAV